MSGRESRGRARPRLCLALLLTGPLLSALLLLCPLSGEAADLVETLNALRTEKDPERRAALVPALVHLGGDRAAEALARRVRIDEAVEVRTAAARGLGEIKAKKADSLVMGLVRHGGTLGVRAEVARAAARRGLGERLIRVIDTRMTPPLDRDLCVRALGYFGDPTTRAYLLRLATLRASSERARSTRCDAIRAWALRGDATHERLRLFVQLISRPRNREVLLSALDVLAPFVHAVHRPALLRLQASKDAHVQAAAAYVLRQLTRSEAARAAAKKKPGKAGKAGKKAEPGGRYAPPGGGGSTPTEPPTDTPKVPDVPTPHPEARLRLDSVWVIDATGSTGSTLYAKKARLLAHIRLISEPETSWRVGIVIFRGGHFQRDHRAGTSVLPLTSDVDRITTFLGGIRASGVDDRGSATPYALHVALDQMSWRRSARRTVHFEADGGCRNPTAAKRTLAQHFQADRTRTFFTFTRRTRTVIPPELNEMAVLGGTKELRVR